MQNSKTHKLSSCLSFVVQNLFYKALTDSTEMCFRTSQGRHTLLLDWKQIYKKVFKAKNISTATEDRANYSHLIRRFAPFLNHVRNTYCAITTEELSVLSQYLKWTHNENGYVHAWKLLVAEEDQCSAPLALLILTSHFERALGNVFLIKGKKVPFLMRDLLATDELEETIGVEAIQALKLMMGNPAALNLRNLLWHGFLAPSELDSRYGLFLFSAAVTIGEALQATYSTIPRRKQLSLEISKCLNDFPDTINSDKIKAVFEAADILHGVKPYFFYSIKLFERNRFGECVIVLLPALECVVRCLFAASNNCPERILTAECDTFYTTFDEILSKMYNDVEENKLQKDLTGHLFEMLLDMINYQNGPRVRDRLSHGEADYEEVPQQLASHLLHLSACVCAQTIANQPSEYVATLLAVTSGYKAHFHPTSLLLAKVQCLLDHLKSWHSESVYCSGLTTQHENVEPLNLVQSLLNSMKLNRLISVNDSTLLQDLTSYISSLVLLTLFRSRQEQEAVSVLHHVATNTLNASTNVVDTLHLKHKKFVNRELRSRQRTNYQKLQTNFPKMYKGLVCLSVVITYFLGNINIIGEMDTKDYHQYLKFSKKMVQYSERLEILSNSDNNEWDAICKIHQDFYILLSKFENLFPLVSGNCK